MGKRKHGKRNYRRARDRNISVRGVRRNPPDLNKLSQALVALALAQAEAEAQADHDQRSASGLSAQAEAGGKDHDDA